MSIALNPRYSVSQNGAVLTITDLTGQYSSINLEAWGTPNQDISTALVATLDISKRNSDGTYGDVTVIDLYPTLPSDNGASFDISAEDAGQGSVFSDGIYKLRYYVSGDDGGTPYNSEKITYKCFNPAIDCCYAKKSAKASKCCNECNEKLEKMAINMLFLKWAKCNGDLESIQSYLDCLTEICNDCSCD